MKIPAPMGGPRKRDNTARTTGWVEKEYSKCGAAAKGIKVVDDERRMACIRILKDKKKPSKRN